MASLAPLACFHPLTGYKPLDGSVKLTFKKAEGYVDRPIKLACGQCRGCRLEHSRQWAVRCMHEAQMHPRNSFLTLTYSDEQLPADKSVNEKHWQKFAKRLRYWQGPFRFYHCGEYGEGLDPDTGQEKKRPHYHALIFGLDFFEDRKFHKMSKRFNGHRLYKCEALDELWSHGHCYIGEVTQQSASYVARYCMKKLGGKHAEQEYEERLDQDTGEVEFYRKPPYATMSLKPGIGATWLKRFHGDVYPADEVISDGFPTRPPRYYDSLLERNDPKLHATIKSDRQKEGRKHKDNNTPERLAIREHCLEDRIQNLQRNTNLND